MTQTLETLNRNTRTLESIRGIVHTMKTLSAINARPYEHAVRSVEAYHETILQSFKAFLHRNGPLSLTQGDTPVQVVVVFGSDHGMCGSYNENVAAEVTRYLDVFETRGEPPHVLCVGAQLNDALMGRDVWAESYLLPPASADGIGRLSSDIVTLLDEIRQNSPFGEIAVSLVFTEQVLHGQHAPTVKTLLPLDPSTFGDTEDQLWISRSLPDFTMRPNELLAALIRSHLFASIYRASAEALLTENAARLSQMQQAEKSVDDRLEELKSETRMVRQTEITNELMDVIIGFEALRKKRKKR